MARCFHSSGESLECFKQKKDVISLIFQKVTLDVVLRTEWRRARYKEQHQLGCYYNNPGKRQGGGNVKAVRMGWRIHLSSNQSSQAKCVCVHVCVLVHVCAQSNFLMD